jgi:hypothetical protein
VVDGNELFLAFRVFATGFAGGERHFGGVKLRSHRPQQARRRKSIVGSPTFRFHLLCAGSDEALTVVLQWLGA